MTNKTTPHAELAEAHAGAEAAASAEARTASGTGASPEADAKADATNAHDGAFEVLTKLQAENAELKDRLLRTLAEMENLRKRTDREVADSRVYGVTAFARDMLGVADNMRRALTWPPNSNRSKWLVARWPIKAREPGRSVAAGLI